MHQIVGGNSFNATMTKGDVSTGASCTTCSFTEDLSNYWTANLYFKARNGSFKRVPQGGAAYVLLNHDNIEMTIANSHTVFNSTTGLATP